MISVIIPAYDVENVIEKCLRSLQQQSYTDFECIILDDASTDGTRAVVERVISGDERFCIVSSSQNMGASRCRNRGIGLASRTYLAFLDADDWMDPQALGILLSQSEDHELDYCFSSHNEYVERQHRAKLKNAGLIGDRIFSRDEMFSYIENYLSHPCEYYGLVHCWGRLYKKDIVMDNGVIFDPDLAQMEDVSFNFRYLRYCRKVGFVDRYLYTHRIPVTGNLGSKKGTEPSFDAKLLQAMAPIYEYLSLVMQRTDRFIVEKLSHFYSSMMIVSIIRMSRIFYANPTATLYRKIGDLIRARPTQTAIRFYQPSGSDSRFIGVAIRWQLTSLALFICLLKRVLGVPL